jgi:hypothetical protein
MRCVISQKRTYPGKEEGVAMPGGKGEQSLRVKVSLPSSATYKINQVRYFNITLTRFSPQLRHRGRLRRLIGAKDEPRNDVGVYIVVQKTY